MDLWFTPRKGFTLGKASGDHYSQHYFIEHRKTPKTIPKDTVQCIDNFDKGMLQIDQKIVNLGTLDATIDERIIANASYLGSEQAFIAGNVPGLNGYAVNLKDDANITDYSDKKNYICTVTCPFSGFKCDMKVDCVEN